MDFSSATRLLVRQCWASAGIQVLNLKFSKRRISAAGLGFKRWALLSDTPLIFEWKQFFSKAHIRLLHCWHLPLTLDDLKWHQMVFTQTLSLKAFFGRHRIQPMDTANGYYPLNPVGRPNPVSKALSSIKRRLVLPVVPLHGTSKFQKRSIAPARRPMIIPWARLSVRKFTLQCYPLAYPLNRGDDHESLWKILKNEH